MSWHDAHLSIVSKNLWLIKDGEGTVQRKLVNFFIGGWVPDLEQILLSTNELSDLGLLDLNENWHVSHLIVIVASAKHLIKFLRWGLWEKIFSTQNKLQVISMKWEVSLKYSIGLQELEFSSMHLWAKNYYLSQFSKRGNYKRR